MENLCIVAAELVGRLIAEGAARDIEAKKGFE